MLEVNKIYNMDCIEGMKLIPDWSIDCIITDPPYWTTACKWDTIIPFEPMWEQLKRIIKPNWAIVLFGSEPFSSALRMSNIKNYKYDWKWIKTKPTWHLLAKKMPMRDYEDIMIFSYTWINYNPQWLIDIVPKTITRTNTWWVYSDWAWKPSIQRQTNYPRMSIKFWIEEWIHPTQKPVALIEYLIKTYTNEWETVLDFTMGSGTTAIACINTNRNYIWFELDEWYRHIANKRIQDIQSEKIKE